MCWQEKDFSAG